jgi:hypothetical protein
VPAFDPLWVVTVESGKRAATPVRDPVAYIRSIRAVAGHRGHDQCFRAACVLRDAGHRPEEALAALIQWNTSNAEPPFSLKELTHKVTSAFERGLQKG